MPATEAQKEQVKSLWMQGWSGLEICNEMNLASRGVVSGIISRAGLSRAVRSIRHRSPRVNARPIVERPAPVVPAVIAPPKMRKVKLLNLKPIHCRYPVGNPRDKAFFFCGANKIGGSVYCGHHHALCTRPLPQKR